LSWYRLCQSLRERSQSRDSMGMLVIRNRLVSEHIGLSLLESLNCIRHDTTWRQEELTCFVLMLIEVGISCSCIMGGTPYPDSMIV
jgi:hypothetical protein